MGQAVVRGLWWMSVVALLGIVLLVGCLWVRSLSHDDTVGMVRYRTDTGYGGSALTFRSNGGELAVTWGRLNRRSPPLPPDAPTRWRIEASSLPRARYSLARPDIDHGEALVSRGGILLESSSAAGPYRGRRSPSIVGAIVTTASLTRGEQRGPVMVEERGFRAVVPAWLVLIGLLLPVPLAAYRRGRRYCRQLLGQCPACGYDLRASLDRCPECGIETAGYDAAGSDRVKRKAMLRGRL